MGKITTLDQLAQSFSEVIAGEYRECLALWKAIYKEDREKTQILEKRMKIEVPIVKESAYRKTLEIMNNAEKRNNSFFRKVLFRNKNVIKINKKLGFYDNLLEGKDITNCFSVNVEYHIDISNLSFIKIKIPHRR